jgi:hypothetical protein
MDKKQNTDNDDIFKEIPELQTFLQLRTVYPHVNTTISVSTENLTLISPHDPKDFKALTKTKSSVTMSTT